MPQSLSRVFIHTIFSTKNREPFFEDTNLRAETHAYLGGTCKSLDCVPVKIGGVSDHVHLLTTLSRSIAIAELVKEIKRVSTNWLHERGPDLASFRWQAGYGVFSVSQSRVDEVVNYIDSQEQHHRKVSFQDEFRQFMRKHNIECDERYVWD